MNHLITKSQKSMLWQDELGDPFLLLKCAEVFEYSKTELRVHCFIPQRMALLQKMGFSGPITTTDDPLVIFNVNKAFLPILFKWGGFKRRPALKGAWLKDKEKRLAHKIFPYNPVKYGG